MCCAGNKDVRLVRLQTAWAGFAGAAPVWPKNRRSGKVTMGGGMKLHRKVALDWILATTLGGSVAWVAGIGAFIGIFYGIAFAAMESERLGAIVSRAAREWDILPFSLAALVVAGVVFGLAQWLAVRQVSPIWWCVEAVCGCIVSLPGAYFTEAFVNQLVRQGMLTPMPWHGDLLSPWVALAVGGLPGGVVPGVVLRLALRRGRTVLWVLVSMMAWGLGTGMMPVGLYSSGLLDLFGLLVLPGAVGGLTYGVVLGLYLLPQLSERTESRSADGAAGRGVLEEEG